MAETDVGKVVTKWLKSCERKGKVSRNTIAVGIVILDHLLQKCPLSIEEGFSGTGSVWTRSHVLRGLKTQQPKD